MSIKDGGPSFTPGPWNARKHGVIVGGPFHQFDGGKAQRQIAMACVISESDGAEDERDANARLIAASLDMYEALKIARDYMANAISARQEEFVGYEEVGGIPQMLTELAQVDAALAKAGGQ